MAFEGAILDFDGTLVDSIDAWHDLEGVLAREAQATVTLEDRKQLIPMSLDEIAQWFHGRFGLGKDAGTKAHGRVHGRCSFAFEHSSGGRSLS